MGAEKKGNLERFGRGGKDAVSKKKELLLLEGMHVLQRLRTTGNARLRKRPEKEGFREV